MLRANVHVQGEGSEAGLAMTRILALVATEGADDSHAPRNRQDVFKSRRPTIRENTAPLLYRTMKYDECGPFRSRTIGRSQISRREQRADVSEIGRESSSSLRPADLTWPVQGI